MNKKTTRKLYTVLLVMCLILTLMLGMSHATLAADIAAAKNNAAAKDNATTLKADANTSFLTATKAAETEEGLIDNGIPILYINIDESQGTIEDMITSPKHQDYCYGAISIDVPEGFHYADFPDLQCESVENLAMEIRGRGNSTWERCAKKPFKIKLDKKADIFGLGKNKHWVLVANAMDVTLLKDRMTAWLGEEMGFAFTPRGVPVDVVLSGEEYGTHYIGSYYLSENVRVGENRLEIEELEEDDTDPEIITGGYLLQQSSQVRPGSPDKFDTSRGAKWATHTPSFDTEGEEDDDEQHGPFGEEDDADAADTADDADAADDAVADDAAADTQEEAFAAPDLTADAYKNEAQQKYIQNYIQDFEDVLFDGTTSYRDLMDIESAAKYWLFNTLSMNSDAYGTGSTYIYKDRDKDGQVSKIYWGPLWDFDFAWNVNTPPKGFEYYHVWLVPMFCDRAEGGFVDEVKKQWAILKEKLEELVKDGGMLDQYAAETLKSANSNNEVWPQDGFDYLKEVEKLKDWMKRRIAWMDENFDQVNDLAHKVTFVVDGEMYDFVFMGYDEVITGKEDHPEKEGYTFLGWEDEDGNLIDPEYSVEKDMTLTAKYIPDDEVTHVEDIALSKNCDIVAYNQHIYIYEIKYAVIPEDAQDKIVEWTSSDEDRATVDQDGVVNYSGTGEYIFTAKMKSGKVRTFTLTVIEGDVPLPEEIYPDEEEIRLTVGEQSPCSISTKPSPAKIYQDDYKYESDDESVVTVGEYGVLTAVGPGQTKVWIRVPGINAAGEEVTLETYATVIVTDPEEEAAEYTAENESATWTKSSSEKLIITVKRSKEEDTCFSHFSGVYLDDTQLEQGRDYTAISGSTIVTINPEVLEGLSAGTHTVKVMFDDGEAQVTLEIAEAEDSGDKEDSGGQEGPDDADAPKTGDEGGAVWIVLMMLALAGGGAAIRMRQRRKR